MVFFTTVEEFYQISIERDGILYYSGSILPTDNIKITGEMSTVMKDLVGTSVTWPKAVFSKILI